nr:MAG TPA: hypothetical protein [Caudoviricetes sp.]
MMMVMVMFKPSDLDIKMVKIMRFYQTIIIF